MMLSRAELQIIELIWQATTFGPEVWHPPDSPAVEARNSHGSAQTDVNLGLPIWIKPCLDQVLIAFLVYFC